MNSTKIKDLISLKGHISLVTGGAGLLGTAISEALAELGSDMIIVGRRKKEGHDFVKKLSKKFNVVAEFEEVDVNSKISIDKFFEKNKKNIDILVNDAFTWPTIKKFEDTTWENFEFTLRSGITSPFYVTKKTVEIMKSLKKGSIINIGSMYGVVSPNFKIYHNKPKMGNALAYNASKAGIIQMTKYLAVHCAQWNIRVNCISPGAFPPPGTFVGKKWFEKELKGMNPLHRLGEPWQLKGAVALLASELGSYMTGQNISVDGGWTIW